jgi:hypothetical protein
LPQLNEVLLSDVTRARRALRKLLVGRIRFEPVGERGYRLRWELRLNGLIDQGYISLASPRGFEPYAGDLVLPLVA